MTVGGATRSLRVSTASDHLPIANPRNLLFFGVLYLCATSRWGSYIGPPGLPVYIGDVFLLAALVQVGLALHGSSHLRGVLSALKNAPQMLLLTIALLLWVILRAAVGLPSLLADPLVALRDLAPYGYAAAALLAFLLPVAEGKVTSTLIYWALALHLLWVQGAGYLPGWPQHWPSLGGAAVLTSRPDFDTAILGVAVALSLHQWLHRRPSSRWALAGLGLFTAANAYALLSSPTRAGLLAGLIASAAVAIGGILRGKRTIGRLSRRARGLISATALLAFVGLLALTPPGQRITDSVRGEESNALGTVNARELAWRAVDRYVRADATRTAAGVGFGPDFLSDSGATYLLEGDVYKDVRSPHNFLVGAFARLGLAGMLFAALVLLTAGLAALRALAMPLGTANTMAALLLLTLPVTALLGVVLESPFGAIPYFWAVGQLARYTLSDRAAKAGVPQDEPVTSVQ